MIFMDCDLTLRYDGHWWMLFVGDTQVACGKYEDLQEGLEYWSKVIEKYSQEEVLDALRKF